MSPTPRPTGGRTSPARARAERITAALLINAAVWAVYAFFLPVAEKTDDYVMKCILSGAYSGKNDAHILYCSFFLGAVLKRLTAAFPTVAWLEVSEHLTVFLSLSAITALCWQPKRRLQSLMTVMPLLAVFGLEGYVKLTFSKPAAMAFAAGFLLFMLGLDKEGKKRGVLLASGAFFALLGTLFRFKMIYIMLPALLAVFTVKAADEMKNREASKTLIKKALACAALLAVCFAVKEAGIFFFSREEGWAAYKDYNVLKVSLQDYGWPDYLENRRGYVLLGVSENDYLLWNARDYGDPDRFTTELMEQIVSMKNQGWAKLYLSSFAGFLRTYPLNTLSLNMFIPLLALSVMLCAGSFKRKKLLLGHILLSLLVIYYYLYANGRYGQTHIDCAIMLSACAPMLFFMRTERIGRRKAVRLCALLTALALFWGANDAPYMRRATYSSSSILTEYARAAADLMTSDRDNLYIISNNEYYGLLRSYGAFEPIEPGAFENTFVLSAYMYPSHNAVLSRYGKDNALESMCDENVLYIATEQRSNEALILGYLREHCHPDAVSFRVKNAYGCYVTKFYSSPALPDISSAQQPDSDIVMRVRAYIEKEQPAVPSGGEPTRSISLGEDEREVIHICGRVYKSGDSSFSQRLYLVAERPGGQVTAAPVLTGNLRLHHGGVEEYLEGNDLDGQFSMADCAVTEYLPGARYSLLLEDSEGRLTLIKLEISRDKYGRRPMQIKHENFVN